MFPGQLTHASPSAWRAQPPVPLPGSRRARPLAPMGRQVWPSTARRRLCQGARPQGGGAQPSRPSSLGRPAWVGRPVWVPRCSRHPARGWQPCTVRVGPAAPFTRKPEGTGAACQPQAPLCPRAVLAPSAGWPDGRTNPKKPREAVGKPGGAGPPSATPASEWCRAPAGNLARVPTGWGPTPPPTRELSAWGRCGGGSSKTLK